MAQKGSKTFPIDCAFFLVVLGPIGDLYAKFQPHTIFFKVKAIFELILPDYYDITDAIVFCFLNSELRHWLEKDNSNTDDDRIRTFFSLSNENSKPTENSMKNTPNSPIVSICTMFWTEEIDELNDIVQKSFILEGPGILRFKRWPLHQV